MIAKTLFFIAVATVSIAAARAGESTPFPPHDFVSTVTRAEVRDATIEFLKSNGHPGGDRTVFIETTGVAKTRAQVVAETVEAIRLGVVDRGVGSTTFTEAQLESIRMAGLKALPMDVATR